MKCLHPFVSTSASNGFIVYSLRFHFENVNFEEIVLFCLEIELKFVLSFF